MTERERRRLDPWVPALVLSVAAFAGSLAMLAAAVIDARGNDASPAAASVESAPGAGTVRPLAFSGALPDGLDAAQFRPAEGGERADIVFEASAAGGVVHRYFVPVAALGAGVDALDSTTLHGLLDGTIANWREAGGVPGKVTFVVAGPPADVALERQFAGGATPARAFATYAELRAAMTVTSGLVAFVPLDEVRPSLTAIQVDGIDVVRDRGDVQRWPFVERVGVNGLSPQGQRAAPEIAARLRAEPPRATTVVATGDILQSRCTLAKIEALGDWGAPLRGPVGEYLAAADLALGSLDGSIQDINPPYRCVAITNLSSPPQALEALRRAGIDEVTVATNHVFDCGREYCGARAFLRTLELLHGAGIKTVGGGQDLEEALAPAVFEVGGVRFGVLGFDDVAAMDLEATETAPGTAPLDDDYSEERAAGEPAFYRPASELGLTRFTGRIRKLKSEVDVVIVQVQTGTEDTHDPTPRSIKALRAAVAAGADLVVGNQAHWVQAVETPGDAFIAYALGNFIFDQQHTVEQEQGYLLEATFWGKRLANVRLAPYHIGDQYHPAFVTAEERAKILADVFSAAERLPAAP